MDAFRVSVYEGVASIYTPYNKDFVSRIKLLGARWNADARCWQINERAIEDVRNAMREIYGRDDLPITQTVDVELVFSRSFSALREPVTIMGRTIASAYGRDSGARIGDGVMFLSGNPESGGSVKNWNTVIPEGCVIKLPNLPKPAFDNGKNILPEGVICRIVNESIDRESLLKEREKLLARLEEIENLLNTDKNP